MKKDRNHLSHFFIIGGGFEIDLKRHAMRANIIFMNTQEELIRLKENTGMNWKAFAQYFDIPYRTVQDWYLGKRSMPDYLLRLMSYKIETEELHRSR